MDPQTPGNPHPVPPATAAFISILDIMVAPVVDIFGREADPAQQEAQGGARGSQSGKPVLSPSQSC